MSSTFIRTEIEAGSENVDSMADGVESVSKEEAGKAEKPPATALEQVEYLAAHPVFVGGAHKSGTTLLRNLLDSHESLFVLPLDGKGVAWFENWLAKSLSHTDFIVETSRSMLSQFVRPNYKLPPYFILTGEEQDWEPYRRFVRYYSYLLDRYGYTPGGAMTAAMGAAYAVVAPVHGQSYKYFVEKTTLNTAWSKHLIGSFPQARFLSIQRDPASVIVSQKSRQSLKRRQFNILYELEYLRQMKVQTDENQRLLGPGVFHQIEYEKLLSDTREVMESICGFLDVPYRGSLLNPTVNGIPASANTGRGDMRWPAGSVKPRNIEKSNHNLDDAESRALEIYLERIPQAPDGADSRRGCLGFLSAIRELKRNYRADERCVEPSVIRAAYMWLRYKRLPAVRARISSITS